MKTAVIGIILGLFCAGVISLAENRIANGQLAAEGQFPYAVSLQQTGFLVATRGHKCGGALFTRQHVLTTASCLYNYSSDNPVLILASQHRIFAGANLLTNDTSADRVRSIANFTIHPEYTGLPALVNNIAIITLITPFPENVVTPLSLPAANYNPADFTICTMAGWGGNDTINSVSTEQRFARKYIYNQALCMSLYNSYPNYPNILPSMVCAVSYDILSSGCWGDNGNALVCGGVFTGVLSISDGCMSSSHPEVYTRVSNYTTWIRSISGSPSLYSSGILLAVAFLFVAQVSLR